MNLLVGCDPEVFFKIKQREIYVPSIGLIGGTKEKPIEVRNGGLQEDNVTAEFNVNPTDDPDRFSFLVHDVKSQLDDVAEEFGLETSIKSSAVFEREAVDTPEAKVIGCDPDLNAYTKQENNYRIDYENKPIRYAGGHIHLGHKDIVGNPARIIDLVKIMDLYVGSTMALLDEDTERRKFYGQAGNYRPKPYGVEYRTSTNTWLIDKDLTRDVHLLTKRAFEAWKEGKHSGDNFKDIQKGINLGDKDLIKSVLPEPSNQVVRKY